MTMNVNVTVESQKGEFIGDLPVSYYYTVPNNYVGLGGYTSKVTSTYTNAEGMFTAILPDISGYETPGTNNLYVQTQQIKSTSYSTTTSFSGFQEVSKTYRITETYKSSKQTFQLPPSDSNKIINTTLIVAITTTKSLYATHVTTSQVSTTSTYISTTVTSKNNNENLLNEIEVDFSKLGSAAQTDIEIVGIIIALVAVAGILIYVIKLRGGGK